MGKLRLAIPEWCEPDWRALMESCWVEDPSLRPTCRCACFSSAACAAPCCLPACVHVRSLLACQQKACWSDPCRCLLCPPALPQAAGHPPGAHSRHGVLNWRLARNAWLPPPYLSPAVPPFSHSVRSLLSLSSTLPLTSHPPTLPS